MKKNNRAVFCTAAILAAVYAISFISGVHNRSAERKTASALMNSKYEKTVSEIQITGQDGNIRLFRDSVTQLWQGQSGNAVFPVDNEQVQKFIAGLTKVRSMYTISDSQKKWASFLLTEDSGIRITYRNNDNMSTKLYFGGQNFDKSRRYFRTENRITSYEIDSDLDIYLSAKPSFWYDPYILPRNVPGTGTVQEIQRMRVNGITYTPQSAGFTGNCEKFTELRHGDITSVPDGIVPEYSIEAESGSGLGTHIQVYDVPDGKILAYTFENTLTGKKYNYSYAVMISAWTAGRMDELFPAERG